MAAVGGTSAAPSGDQLRAIWGRWVVAAVVRAAEAVVDFFARRADRIFVRIPARNPDFAAERDDWTARDRRFHNLFFAHVMSETLVVAIVEAFADFLALQQTRAGARARATRAARRLRAAGRFGCEVQSEPKR